MAATFWRETVWLLLGCMLVCGNSAQADVVYGTAGNFSIVELTVHTPVSREQPVAFRDICPGHCDEEGHKYKAKQCIMPPHCCHNGMLLECCSNASRAISDDIEEGHNCMDTASEYWQLVLAVCVPLATLSLIAFLGMTSYLMCRRKRARQSGRQRTGSGSDVSCSSWSVSTISPNNTVRGNPTRSPGGTPDCGSRRHRRGGGGSHNNNNPHCDIFVLGSMSPSIPPPYIDKPPPYSITCNGPGSNRAFDMVETDSLPDYYELLTLDSAADHSVHVASLEQETQVDTTVNACPEYEEIQEVNFQPAVSDDAVIHQTDSQVSEENTAPNNQHAETRGNQHLNEDQVSTISGRCICVSINLDIANNHFELDEGMTCIHEYSQVEDALQQTHYRNCPRFSDRDPTDMPSESNRDDSSSSEQHFAPFSVRADVDPQIQAVSVYGVMEDNQLPGHHPSERSMAESHLHHQNGRGPRPFTLALHDQTRLDVLHYCDTMCDTYVNASVPVLDNDSNNDVGNRWNEGQCTTYADYGENCGTEENHSISQTAASNAVRTVGEVPSPIDGETVDVSAIRLSTLSVSET